MIYLEQGQKVLDRPELVVYEPTGERNDTDMVICAEAKNPGEPFCWLEAQYIAYGGVVYKISDEKELETEILKIDPDSSINEVALDPVSSTVEDSALKINEPIQEVQIQPSASPEFVPQTDVVSEVQSEILNSGPAISETSTSTNSIHTDSSPVVDTVATSSAPVLEVLEEVVPETAPVLGQTVEPSPVIEPVVSYIKKAVRKSLS